MLRVSRYKTGNFKSNEMISRLAHDHGVSSLICCAVYQYPYCGFVEFHAFFAFYSTFCRLWCCVQALIIVCLVVESFICLSRGSGRDLFNRLNVDIEIGTGCVIICTSPWPPSKGESFEVWFWDWDEIYLIVCRIVEPFNCLSRGSGRDLLKRWSRG